MEQRPVWQADEVLAWTDHDGPRRAPSGANRAVWFVLAGILGVVFAGIVLSDTLCPEHRAWVKTLGALALVGTATAIVGLIRGWAAAPLITLASAAAGVAIGVIDTIHDPTRGRLVTLAFGVVLVLSALECVRQLLLRRWDVTELTPVTATHSSDAAPAPHATDTIAPAPATVPAGDVVAGATSR